MGDFEDLVDKLINAKTLADMLSASTHENDDDLRASYNIPITKADKVHTICETLIAPVICKH